jgi:hypothetical protein
VCFKGAADHAPAQLVTSPTWPGKYRRLCILVDTTATHPISTNWRQAGPLSTSVHVSRAPVAEQHLYNKRNGVCVLVVYMGIVSHHPVASLSSLSSTHNIKPYLFLSRRLAARGMGSSSSSRRRHCPSRSRCLRQSRPGRRRISIQPSPCHCVL